MPRIKSFKGIHPTKEYAARVPISHGIGGDAEKSTEEIHSNPFTLLKITNPEYFLPSGLEMSETEIQEASHRIFKEYLEKDILVQDEKESLYIYRLTYEGHRQTGIVGKTSMEDYRLGRIKPHELTRVEKAIFQMHLLERVGGYMEPVFLAYDSSHQKLDLLNEIADSRDSDLTFVDNRNCCHQIWVIHDEETIKSIESFFTDSCDFYVCDGHHRIAAALEYSKAHPEDDTHILMVAFPSDETNILDYNRAITDLNGMDEGQFIEALKAGGFQVEMMGKTPIRPENPREYTMVMDSNWYLLKYTGPVDASTPVDSLDVSILQNMLIRDILGITNPQSDSRLSFISGTKGLEGLEEATKKNMKVAFAIRPATMEDIFSVAGAGLTMPPKSTCFEPKPVIGMVLDQF